MNKVEKKENKLKQFVKKHKLAFTIAGGVIVVAAGVVIGYRCFGPKSIACIHNKSTGLEDIEGLLDLCECVDAGTRSTIVWTPKPERMVTVTEVLGESAEGLMQFDNNVQPDDLVANIIFNIAKKPET